MKDKRILSRQMAYVFTEYNDGIEMTDWQGFATCTDDIMELCYGLMKYALKHEDQIETYNQKHRIDLENELRENAKTADKESKAKSYKKGYVYLLECAGRYKIGFSKDVEIRIKQLDTRPFKIKLIAKSKIISDAYDREQEIHEYFADQRVYGEWYEFSDHEALCAKEIIENLEEGC